MLHALAVIAATVSAIAVLVVLFLTIFMLSLALRANGPPQSRKRTTDA